MAIDVERYIQESQEISDYMKQFSVFISGNQITLGRLNFALANYKEVLDKLTDDYELLKVEAEACREEFQCDWDEWYIEVKADLKKGKPNSVVISDKETDANVRVRHKEKYLEWQGKLKTFQLRESRLRRIIDNWKHNKEIIINMCWNMRTEQQAMYVENFANGKMAGEKKQKIRKENVNE